MAEWSGLQRVDRIIGDPVPGRWYLVPCIYGEWQSYSVPGPAVQWWPVIGGLHNDPEYFHFDTQHYHLDQRFLTIRRSDYDVYSAELAISASPLQTNRRINTEGFGKPEWRRRRCRRSSFDMRDFRHRAGKQLAQMARDHPQAIEGKRGWICPHKKFDMSGISPDAEGNITCPMHGMKFCARTGATVTELPGEKQEALAREIEAALDQPERPAL